MRQVPCFVMHGHIHQICQTNIMGNIQQHSSDDGPIGTKDLIIKKEMDQTQLIDQVQKQQVEAFLICSYYDTIWDISFPDSP